MHQLATNLCWWFRCWLLRLLLLLGFFCFLFLLLFFLFGSFGFLLFCLVFWRTAFISWRAWWWWWRSFLLFLKWCRINRVCSVNGVWRNTRRLLSHENSRLNISATPVPIFPACAKTHRINAPVHWKELDNWQFCLPKKSLPKNSWNVKTNLLLCSRFLLFWSWFLWRCFLFFFFRGGQYFLLWWWLLLFFRRGAFRRGWGLRQWRRLQKKCANEREIWLCNIIIKKCLQVLMRDAFNIAYLFLGVFLWSCFCFLFLLFLHLFFFFALLLTWFLLTAWFVRSLLLFLWFLSKVKRT